MTRDLMPQFIRLHEQSYQQSSEDEERDFLMEVDEPFVDHHLPDDVEDFLLMITDLHQRVEQIHVLLADLKKHQGEIISEIHMDKRLHEEHDILVSEIKKESSSVNEQIKRLKVVVEGEKRDGYITTEGKMKRDQVNVLVSIFQEVMEEFNRTQIEHRDHCKNRIKRQFEICGHDVDGEDIEEMLENNEVNVFTKHLGIDDLAKTQNALREVENRHADILKLEQSITDLFEVFQEIAILVEMQGGLIDNIQHNVEETIIIVEESQQQLRKAMKYKRRNIFTCCCPAFVRNSIHCCTVM